MKDNGGIGRKGEFFLGDGNPEAMGKWKYRVPLILASMGTAEV